MQRGTEAMWQGRAWPTQGASGADTWQEAMRVHVDARAVPVARGMAGEGPTG